MQVLDRLFNDFDFPGKFIYMVAMAPKTSKTEEPHTVTRFVTDREHAKLFIDTYRNSHNIYFGINPRKEANRKMSGVECVHCVWVDIDKTQTIPDYILPPSIVVSSGNGLHMYWKLKECIYDFTEASSSIQILEKTLGADSTSDVTRILRVDDTFNYKPKDVDAGDFTTVVKDVTILLNNPEAVYELSDITNACNVSTNKVKSLIAGELNGYKSRSERDYALVEQLIGLMLTDLAIESIFKLSPCGDKFAERGGDYLERTISKVRGKLNITQSTIDAYTSANEGIYEADNAYWKIVSTKKDNVKSKKLSSFVLRPKYVVASSKEDNNTQTLIADIVTDTEIRTNYEFARSAFQSNKQLKEALKDIKWIWYGTDADVINFNAYLVNMLPSEAVKERIKQLGYYDDGTWVGGDMSYYRGEWIPTEYTRYLYSNKQDHIKVKYATNEILDERQYLQKTIHHLTQLNDAGKIFPILGWFCATLFKSRIAKFNSAFPLLNLYGTRESGKTQTIMILQQLACYVTPRNFDCMTTPFSIVTLFNSTKDVLVSLSEYRESDLKSIQSLNRNLLLAYDNGESTRGTKEQSINKYTMSAPITIDGEDAVSDPALLGRCLQVPLSRNDLDSHRAEHLIELKSMDLSVLGTRLLEYSIPKDFREYLSQAAGMCKLKMSSRVRYNVEVSLAGLLFFQDYMNSLGMELEIDCDWFENIVTQQETNVTVIDTFVTDIVSVIAREKNRSPFNFRIDSNEHVLRFHFTSVYNFWREKYAKHQPGSVGSKAIKTQLKERYVTGNTDENDPSNYVLPPKTVAINGSAWHCYGIDLRLAKQAGLDIPDEIKSDISVTIKRKKK